MWCKKINLKMAVQLLVAWGIVMLLIMYSWGWFTHNAQLKDILAVRQFHQVASGESWELSASENFGYRPFLVYKGSGKIENTVKIHGIIDRKMKVNDGKEYMEGPDPMETEFVMDRHFFIGEKRWYYRYANEIFRSACLEITWKENGKIHSELIASEKLNEDQISEIKEKYIDQRLKEYDYLDKIFGESKIVPVEE